MCEKVQYVHNYKNNHCMYVSYMYYSKLIDTIVKTSVFRSRDRLEYVGLSVRVGKSVMLQKDQKTLASSTTKDILLISKDVKAFLK